MRSSFAALLSLAATLAAASAGAAQASAPALHAKPLVRGTGTYKNVDYGYRVRLPDGVVYERTPAPFPNHGFQVPLAAGDTVRVDATYTDSLTLAGVAGEDAGLRAGCTIASRHPARLGPLPAVEVFYLCAGEIEERKVLALRDAIVYTVAVSRVGGVTRRGAELWSVVRREFATTPR